MVYFHLFFIVFQDMTKNKWVSFIFLYPFLKDLLLLIIFSICSTTPGKLLFFTKAIITPKLSLQVRYFLNGRECHGKAFRLSRFYTQNQYIALVDIQINMGFPFFEKVSPVAALSKIEFKVDNKTSLNASSSRVA